MKIQYVEREGMPEVLNIYLDSAEVITFYDDGTGPDYEANDYVYAAYVREDIEAFVAKIVALESTIETQGYVHRWAGHLGEEVSFEELELFDIPAFEAFEEVKVDALLINAFQCSTTLAKEKSLFITDLSVVEDPFRTYDVSENEGTPMGVWTFGKMISNIVNSSTPGAKKNFLKQWIKTWTDDQVVNGHTVLKREDILPKLVEPWLKKCNINILNQIPGCATPPGQCTTPTPQVTLCNWECLWDNSTITEADLLKYAPFKLTAIVNRIDLMGNTGYTGGISNAGETRFIFSLIDPFTGEVPLHQVPPPAEPGINGNGIPEIDWSGCNIIFEYNNLQQSRCAVKELAQKWLDLSAYPLPDANFEYNDALEELTNLVTAPNLNSTHPTGSALARIRTNERLFSHFNTDGGGTFLKWTHMDWEFRQFAVGSNGLLQLEPLTNTPSLGGHWMTYVEDNDHRAQIWANLNQWIAANITKVASGTHSMPSNFLAGSGLVTGEFLHYLQWDPYYAFTSYPANFRKVRTQLSLNTCQGCHNGETKTLFAHVLPLADEEPANYWRAATSGLPDHKTGLIERHVPPKVNIGETQLSSGTVQNFPEPDGTRRLQNVSAFLTGRNTSGKLTSYAYEDDHPSDLDDEFMKDFFWVNDPINSAQGTHWEWEDPLPQGNSLRNGYNDLQRRMDFMCKFLNFPCSNGDIVMEILSTVEHIPFAKGMH